MKRLLLSLFLFLFPTLSLAQNFSSSPLGITAGSTPISGCTSLQLFYNNAGALGCMAGTSWNITSQALSFSGAGVFTNTQANLNFQSNINGATPGAWYFTAHPAGNYPTFAITGAIEVPATATVHESAGVAGIVRTKKPVANGSDAGGYFQAMVADNNVSGIGINTECFIEAGLTTGEVCQNVYRTRVYSPGATVIGQNVVIDGDTAPTSAHGVNIASSNPSVLKFDSAFVSDAGAATVGMELGPVATGASQSSQPLKLIGTNAASVLKSATFQADLDGNLTFTPQTWANFVGKLGVGVSNPTGKLEVASGSVATSQPIKFSQTWDDGGASVAFSTFEIRNSNVSSNVAASDIFAVYSGAAGTTKLFNIAGTGETTVASSLTANSLKAAITYSPQVIGGAATNSTLTLLSAGAAGTTDKIVFGTNLTARWNMLNSGEFQPAAANTYDIGDATNTVRTGYFGTGLSVAGNAGLSVTKTVRASGGLSDCTLIFTGGLLTGGTC